jgi:hypothetical protein
MARQAWICLGEVDEHHPFCPFATYDRARADKHAEMNGHWIRVAEPEDIRTALWAESLRQERLEMAE